MPEDIAYQNKDILFKFLAEKYRNLSLKVYGIEAPKIKEMLPTNFPIVEVNENEADSVFLLEDDSIFDLEYESNLLEENINKYLKYVYSLHKKYNSGKNKKDYKKIRVVVIYTSDIKNTKSANDKRFLDIMSLKFQFEQIFLSDFNGQEMYSNLKYKLDNNLKLEENDILKLIILPLVQNEDRQKAIKDTVELAKQIPDEKNKAFALAGIITATDKFINEENLIMIRKELSMTRFERLLEEEKEEIIKQKEIEKEEAIEENKKKIVKNLFSLGIDILTIMKATGLTKEEVLKIQQELN